MQTATKGALHRETPASKRLAALGQSLYGEHWLKPMARDLKIRPDTIAKWLSGKRDLTDSHPIFEALAVLIRHHEKGVAKACDILDCNR
jgi:hypothetical protein